MKATKVAAKSGHHNRSSPCQVGKERKWSLRHHRHSRCRARKGSCLSSSAQVAVEAGLVGSSMGDAIRNRCNRHHTHTEGRYGARCLGHRHRKSRRLHTSTGQSTSSLGVPNRVVMEGSDSVSIHNQRNRYHTRMNVDDSDQFDRRKRHPMSGCSG